MYVNAEMIDVETVPGTGEGRWGREVEEGI
jgi:hypothetical protein